MNTARREERISRWGLALLPAVVMLGFGAAGSMFASDSVPPPKAQVANERNIPGAPLDITLREGLAASVTFNGAEQFFANFDSGTFVVLDGVVYGPQPTGNDAGPDLGARVPFEPVAYTPLDNQGPTGTGIISDPFRITTTVMLGTTGLTLTQTTSYITGSTSLRTDIVLSNTTTLTKEVRVFHAADLSLNFPGDSAIYGYGLFDTKSGAVGARSVSGRNVQVFLPVKATPPNAYQESRWTANATTGALPFWRLIGGPAGLPGPGFTNTIDQSQHDVAAGLQWDRQLADGTSVTLSDELAFGPGPDIGIGSAIYLPVVQHR